MGVQKFVLCFIAAFLEIKQKKVTNTPQHYNKTTCHIAKLWLKWPLQAIKLDTSAFAHQLSCSEHVREPFLKLKQNMRRFDFQLKVLKCTKNTDWRYLRRLNWEMSAAVNELGEIWNERQQGHRNWTGTDMDGEKIKKYVMGHGDSRLDYIFIFSSLWWMIHCTPHSPIYPLPSTL